MAGGEKTLEEKTFGFFYDGPLYIELAIPLFEKVSDTCNFFRDHQLL